MKYFTANDDGVHLMNGEYTICGDAFDIAETEDDFTAGTLNPTRARTVTCARCIDMIELCRGVRISRGSTG